MSYAILDVESTFFQKGHPYSDRNRLCLVGIRIGSTNHVVRVEYDKTPYGDSLARIRELLVGVGLVVGFNLKFDLGWLLRYGICLPDGCRVFDCQLAEFILGHQQSVFPSLDGCLAKYGLGSKSHTVADGYWNMGIDTDQIPLDVLDAYLQTDLERTDELYGVITGLLDSSDDFIRRKQLIKLHNQDLQVLLEMEYNGIRLDWAAMAEKAEETEKELDGIKREILEFVPEPAREFFTTSSNDHTSLLLYGGTWSGKVPRSYLHTYGSGHKTGTQETRRRWESVSVQFPRLVEPLPRTELKKPGYWATGADVLRELTKPRKLIQLLLKEAELSKLLTTYYHGFPATRDKMDWQDGCIHSTLNQCAVITGRLSSSKPNQQNLDPRMHEFIVSRHDYQS